ncbi:YbaB/EbfC family nucleoid-associated protein [Coxiella endosymbiont of Amblyomma sculptum]|uniref:YbaB/EbfC family nucleoid-associated protein n=1 Tax=Coxiella endosymbiont of Amblyomma sculptum TaxID=2487929 RepID=UPI00132F2F7B|nr:YbaB/EbfC family nucleoid-associated protein [Coxiella endosymbiont of Amblyomma sculptum]QHG92355.1 YbaB/EbfC family nucleoid-associated protein [Coxiella endosymbiont of Amblyomma sculptum]
MIDGTFNLDKLMKSTKKIQEIMQKAQKELSKIEVTGESGAGMVKVTLTAQHEIVSFILSDELFAEKKEVIEALIRAAFNDANRKITKITQEKIISSGKLFGNEEDKN